MSESDRKKSQPRVKHMVRQRHERFLLGVIIVGSLALSGSLAMFHHSGPPAAERHARNDLAAMSRCSLQVKGRQLDLWVARSRTECELGLMWVQPAEMADNQGMLFVFDHDRDGGFWMKNTLIPLDIAFIRHDGTVVDIMRMEPRSLVTHTPRESYQYALEVKAGTLAHAGAQVGDVLPIAGDLLNR
jgi:uncharacterized membrane protein (UPF0127 family)